jgi:hypothetical protein
VSSYVVIGNPDNRRVTMFQAALAAQGRPAARVIAWRDLAEPGASARLLGDLRSGYILRIDSPGEDDEVERAFIRRGEAAARGASCEVMTAAQLERTPREIGRILVPRQHHLGFTAVLREVAAAIPPDARLVQPIAAIAELFDKAACSAKWTALGIPVPDVLPGGPVHDPDDLRERMRAVGWSSVFVKVTSSSSASCLAVFVHRATGEHVMTTVEDTGKARYNTRRIQRLGERARIDAVLGFLLREGSIVERAIPKAQIVGKKDRRYFDLRVLAIDGVAAFVVMRTSAHPITNLHLGGQRGDVAALQQRIDSTTWDRAMASCVAVQRASGAFHVGVDLMFEVGMREHRVIEGNAFGDLLPNLVRDGLDVYGWQIQRFG